VFTAIIFKSTYSFFCPDTKERIKEKVQAAFYPCLPAGRDKMRPIASSIQNNPGPDIHHGSSI
jgi:hypothetical protein